MRNAFQYQAIVSDIDGTLTVISPDAKPTDRVKNTIHRAIQQGFHVSLASGRPYYLIEPLVKELRIVDPCIVDNGAVIIDSTNGSILWQAILPVDHAVSILRYCNSFLRYRVSTSEGVLENPNSIPHSSTVRKISVHDVTISEGEALIRTLSNEFHDIEVIRAAAYGGAHLMDVYISDAHATKQHALLQLADIINVPLDQIIGIGDGHNDYPLLLAAGMGIAMGNAVIELKAIADYEAPSVAEDGLAVVIEKFLLNSKE